MTTPRLTLALVVGLTVSGCSWNLGGSEETAPPTIAAVDPPLGNNATDVRVTVIGTGFFRLLVRDLNSETGFRMDDTYQVKVGGVDCRNVVRVDDDHLLATIPAGLAEGPHDVEVTSPALLKALKEQAYYATSTEAPVLTGVSPRAAVNDAPQTVTVSGTGLRTGALMFAAAGTVDVVDILTATPLPDSGGPQTSTSKEVIIPSALAAGPYTLAVKNPDGQRAQLSGAFSVVDPAQLALTLTAPAQVSVGQTFSIDGALTNAGGSDVENVVLAPVTITGPGNATVGATSTPPSTTVAAMGAGALALTATATQAGTMSVSTRATGTNQFSARPLQSATATTGQVLVQRAAALTATVSVSPASTASVGQSLTVTMQVQNTGQATATNVTPSALVLTGAGMATLVSGPTPPSAATLAGGTSASFSWTYTASAAGAVTFSGSASGSDVNSALTVTSASASAPALAVETAAQLSIVSFAVPGIIARGQTFTASMVVTNIGQADANVVLPVPSPPAATFTGGAAASTSTSVNPATIPGGGTATFTWSYVENGTDTGTIALVAAAAGTDANSGVRVTSASATSNTASVQAGSDLRITSFDIPSALTTGQTFTATVTVQNFGGTTAIGVLPSPN
ncbi:MAG TPA: IPT/TIG domain-containing protein, partial [Myxococcaceae bacterium]|nr:IPT/TIG domain-containing protein [Myxococcaceae bacterium]